MRRMSRPTLPLLVLAAACGSQATPPPAAPTSAPVAAPVPPPAPPPAPPAPRLAIPVEYHKLDNGLRVVLSRDTTAPVVTVAVYYHIGFRIEPKDRTGFAHLFEHMMFQGSENLGKMELAKLVEANGGQLNGSTRFDFTNYFEVAPSNVLETLLWAEADRMRGLAVTEDNLTNQKGVVSNEVRVAVLNRPYGGFPWLDLPQLANENWYNAHNFYGELHDIEAAKLEDVARFFHTYYAPNNAALVVVGDFEPQATLALIEKYYGKIPRADVPPIPDLTEPRQEKEKRSSKVDKLAKRPALAIAYHMPPRGTPEHVAMGVIQNLLASGHDSALYQSLVVRRGLTGDVQADINALGNMWDYQGPMLFEISMFHDADKTPDQLLAAIDEEVEKLRAAPVDADTLRRALVRMRSDYYDTLEQFVGFGKADLLASFALFDDDPARANQIEGRIAQVTPELVLATAKEYLRPTNRTILTVEVKP
jgi:predicted Zn-dependent peptidase